MRNYIHTTCLKLYSFSSLDFWEENYLKWDVQLVSYANTINWTSYEHICAM